MLLSTSTWELEQKLGYEKMFEELAKAGVGAVDFGLDDWAGSVDEVRKARGYLMDDAETVAFYTKVKEAADRCGIVVGQTHSMYGMWDTMSSPEALDVIRKNILATHVLGCSHTVIHPNGTPGRIFNEKKEECFAFNLNYFKTIKPYLLEYGVKNGVEPMWTRDAGGVIRPTVCSDPHEILEFIKELGSDAFCSCPDFGHLLLVEKDTGISLCDALRLLGGTVEIVHIHEVDKLNDSHTLPFTFRGITDWRAVMRTLGEIGYKGTLNLEVGNYFGPFPKELLPMAIRHFAETADALRQMIK